MGSREEGQGDRGSEVRRCGWIDRVGEPVACHNYVIGRLTVRPTVLLTVSPVKLIPQTVFQQ